VAFPTEGRVMSITSEVESPQTIFLKARQVRTRYGEVSHMWLVRRQNDAGFPIPTFFGGLRFWRLSDLQAWDESQKDKPRPPASHGFKVVRS
jgi:predicted DNA-binding transcriptional regulator AlpA